MLTLFKVNLSSTFREPFMAFSQIPPRAPRRDDLGGVRGDGEEGSRGHRPGRSARGTRSALAPRRGPHPAAPRRRGGGAAYGCLHRTGRPVRSLHDDPPKYWSGVTGDPSKASKALGQKLDDLVIGELVKLIEELRRRV